MPFSLVGMVIGYLVSSNMETLPHTVLPRPLIFYNRIPKTGSTSLTTELERAVAESNGTTKLEWFYFNLVIGKHTNQFDDHRDVEQGKNTHGYVCRYLGKLARRPLPAVWAFHVPYFDPQKMCPQEWEEPRLSRVALEDRELNAEGTGFPVWADEIVWQVSSTLATTVLLTPPLSHAFATFANFASSMPLPNPTSNPPCQHDHQAKSTKTSGRSMDLRCSIRAKLFLCSSGRQV